MYRMYQGMVHYDSTFFHCSQRFSVEKLHLNHQERWEPLGGSHCSAQGHATEPGHLTTDRINECRTPVSHIPGNAYSVSLQYGVTAGECEFLHRVLRQQIMARTVFRQQFILRLS